MGKNEHFLKPLFVREKGPTFTVPFHPMAIAQMLHVGRMVGQRIGQDRRVLGAVVDEGVRDGQRRGACVCERKDVHRLVVVG
jgi:hypothetical protein